MAVTGSMTSAISRVVTPSRALRFDDLGVDSTHLFSTDRWPGRMARLRHPHCRRTGSVDLALDDAAARRYRDRLQPGVGVELVEDALDVVPDGVEADVQPFGDDLVRKPAGDEPQNLVLAPAESCCGVHATTVHRQGVRS
jgi:hypothetical protein